MKYEMKSKKDATMMEINPMVETLDTSWKKRGTYEEIAMSIAKLIRREVCLMIG